MLSGLQLSAVSCQLGNLTVRYHNEQAVAYDLSSLAATLIKNGGGVRSSSDAGQCPSERSEECAFRQ